VIERQPHLIGRIEADLIKSLNGFIRLPADGAYIRAPELGSEAGPLGAIALAMQARP
jgi:fructokinase